MQAAGEVPNPEAYKWSPDGLDIGSSIHGTACTEIVYDIAPGASYYLAYATTDVEWADAVDWMISQDVDVISCSTGFTVPIPSLYTKVTSARAAGITWCQSAGNSAQSHWYGNWADTDAMPNGYLDFTSGYDFVPVYLYTHTPLQATLRWNDTWGASGNDYDLLLFNDTSFIVDTLMDYSWDT